MMRSAAPHAAEFKPDDAGADHQHLLRHRVEQQRTGRRYDLLLVDLDAGKLRDVRAGRDDDVLGFERLGATRRQHDLNLAGGSNATETVIRRDLVLLEQELDTDRVALHALVLVGEHPRDIDRRLGVDTHRSEPVLRLMVQLARVQQRLRGDAADVEASAAMRRALLDDGDFHPELGCTDRTHIAAGAGADDDEVVGHDNQPFRCLRYCSTQL